MVLKFKIIPGLESDLKLKQIKEIRKQYHDLQPFMLKKWNFMNVQALEIQMLGYF